MSMTKFHFYHQRGSTQQIFVLFAGVVIFVAIVMAVFGYHIGQKQGMRSAINEAVEEKMEAENQADLAQETALKQKLETAIQEHDIGLKNIQSLHEQNESIKTTNLQLEQLNTMLLQSVAKQGGVPLKVLASEIVSMPDRTFEYRFDVAMVDKSGQSVTMMPKITLLNATNMVEIPVKPATYSIKGIAHIRGRFVMPEGFEPKQIKLDLKAGSEDTEQLYNWQVGKVVSMPDGVNEKELGARPIGQ